MSRFKLTCKLLVCVSLMYLSGNLYIVKSVEIECIPLKSCPTLLKLKATNKYAPETIEFLKNSHCGFDGKGQRMVWCSQLNFCVTPDNINGTCTPLKKCKPFLQLRASLDLTDVFTINYLNKFRCNTILKNVHVCCPQEIFPLRPEYLEYEDIRFNKAHKKPNSFVAPRIPDMRNRFGDPDYENGNSYEKLGDHSEYYPHQNHGMRDIFYRNMHPPITRDIHEPWNINHHHGFEPSWGIPKHIHDNGPESWNIHEGGGSYGHHDGPDFIHDNHRGPLNSFIGFNIHNKPHNHVRVTPDQFPHHNSHNLDSRHGTDVGNNDQTTIGNSWDSPEYTTSKPRTWTMKETTTHNNHGHRTAHGNRFDDTTRRSSWKPQGHSTSRESRTTPEGHAIQTDYKTNEKTTPRNQGWDSTNEYDFEDSTQRNSKRRKPEKQTTPANQYDIEHTTRRKSERRRPEQQTTTINEYDFERTTRGYSRRKRPEQQTTPKNEYDFEYTTLGNSGRRRPEQQATPANRDEESIIFEDGSEESVNKNSWRTPEQTTMKANDAIPKNDQNNRDCETPENKAGICTKQDNCPSYLKLQNNLDKSNKSISAYLNKFRCNSTNTREIYVCCQKEEESDIDNSVFNAERTNENVPEPYSKICGRRTSSTDRIFGGTTAGLGEFPWIALLKYPSNKGLTFGCGGTLINSRYVLTAAHCVDEDILKRRKLQPLRQVILGEYDTRNETDCIYMKYGQDCAQPPKIYGVDSVIKHNLYSSETTRHDIALVRLNQEVTYTDYIKPICLPTKTSTLHGNETFVMAGWGRTLTEASSPVLKKAKIPFVQKENCNARNTKSRFLIEGQICAGRGNGTDSCNGDSGGPVMLEVNFNFEFVTHLVGIISYGFGECGSGPSVNTYVPYYIDWINENIR